MNTYEPFSAHQIPLVALPDAGKGLGSLLPMHSGYECLGWSPRDDKLTKKAPPKKAKATSFHIINKKAETYLTQKFIFAFLRAPVRQRARRFCWCLSLHPPPSPPPHDSSNPLVDRRRLCLGAQTRCWQHLTTCFRLFQRFSNTLQSNVCVYIRIYIYILYIHAHYIYIYIYICTSTALHSDSDLSSGSTKDADVEGAPNLSNQCHGAAKGFGDTQAWLSWELFQPFPLAEPHFMIGWCGSRMAFWDSFSTCKPLQTTDSCSWGWQVDNDSY